MRLTWLSVGLSNGLPRGLRGRTEPAFTRGTVVSRTSLNSNPPAGAIRCSLAIARRDQR